jgi:hypothetical protein
MSSWFTIQEPTVSEDKKTAVFRVQNSTLEPLRAQAAAAAVEMAGAPFEEAHFSVDPALFGLEPGESREVKLSLTDKAPQNKELPARLRVEKADLPDHFVFGPGVTLGKNTKPPIPPWVWFVIDPYCHLRPDVRKAVQDERRMQQRVHVQRGRRLPLRGRRGVPELDAPML